MITEADFERVVEALGDQGRDDIEWSENISEPTHPDFFALEAIYVICNSGMKYAVARKIFEGVRGNLRAGLSASLAFGHKGKAAAIDTIWRDRAELLAGYLRAEDKVAFCGGLPWIGEITKWHLAKNFGADVAKPDVHLQRLADREGVTAQQLCERLAKATGYRIATVDTLLWRACASGIIISKTGEIRAGARAA